MHISRLNLPRLIFAACLYWTWLGAASAAPTLTNPSFEADTLPPAWPHYTSSITGWTSSGGGNTALNDATGPFQNSGYIPDGNLVAVLQGVCSLTQTVPGFVAGKTYRLTLRANSRDFGTGDIAAHLRVALGATELIASTPVPVSPIAQPFQLFSVDFASPGTGSFALSISNTRGDIDNTLLVDEITLVEPPPQWDTWSDTWSATDALGRAVPLNDTTGPPRANKTVAMFYYIWHGQHGTGLYDISQILTANPSNPAWGPVSAFHFQSEPLYGYYQASDAYVHRRNAQFLADAGVDVIFFDVTNGFTYANIYRDVICPLYEQIRATGGKTPQIAFMTHANSGAVVQQLYDEFYSQSLYKDLWFKWKGKPIVLATASEMTPQLLAFFNVRYSWAWDPGQDKWPWLEDTPQQGGWHESASIPEEMAVETAQHPGANSGWGIGKSFHNGVEPTPGNYQSEQGYYFGEHWAHALTVDPQLIFITQWNEWVAQRGLAESAQRYAGAQIQIGDSFFVDVYSPEFNRDIEPMKTGYKDNYYYQMVGNIRRFKGTRALPAASQPKIMDLANFALWDDVGPEYRDDIGDKAARNNDGWGGLHYTNTTGRNDLKRMKIARDNSNVYFYAETVDPLTANAGTNWMRLFIAIDGRGGATWEGYHYLVEPRDATAGSPLVLLQAQGSGWNWQEIGTVTTARSGTQLAVGISRISLGLTAGNNTLAFRFKWSDNMQANDPLDWTLNGDTAPNNRFQYRYQASNQAVPTPTPTPVPTATPTPSPSPSPSPSPTPYPSAFQNPSFEFGTGSVADVWLSAGGADRRQNQPRLGGWSAHFVEPNESTLSQYLSLIPGHSYLLSAWFSSGNLPIELQTRFLVYAPQISNYLGGNAIVRSGTFAWGRQDLVFNAGSATYALFHFSLTGGNAQTPYGDVYMDDVALQDITLNPTPTPTPTPAPTLTPTPVPTPTPPETGATNWEFYTAAARLPK